MKNEPELLKIKSIDNDKETKKAERRAKRRFFFLDTRETGKKREGESNIDKMFHSFFDIFDMLFGVLGIESTDSKSFPSSSLKKNKESKQEMEI
jgi:hypothetical protein